MDPEPITPEVVRHVAALARIAVTEQEVDGLIGDLSRILEQVGHLRRLDLAGVDPMARVSDQPATLGEDVEGATLPLEILMGMAPDTDDRFVKVPKVLGDGGA